MENKINNVSFTARCPQIRKADWICHAVNTGLPHRSSSKMNPLIVKFKQRNFFILHSYNSLPKEAKPAYLIDCTRQEQKILAIQDAITRTSNKVDLARSIFMKNKSTDIKRANGVLQQLKFLNIGNCSETAYASEIALKMNGPLSFGW